MPQSLYSCRPFHSVLAHYASNSNPNLASLARCFTDTQGLKLRPPHVGLPLMIFPTLQSHLPLRAKDYSKN